MNKTQYDKKIEKMIATRSLFSGSLEELIKSDKVSLINNVNVINLVENDIDRILTNSIDKCRTIEYLYSLDDIKPLIDRDIIKYLSYLDYYHISDLIWHYEFDFNLLERINNEFDLFLQYVDLEDILNMYFRDDKFTITDENKKKLNEKIKNNADELSKVLFISGYEDNNDYDSVIEVISKLINELLEEAKLDYTDIVFAGEGSFARAYIIGDKVLKLGKKRNTYNIPNDKRILKPLIRVNLRDYSNIDGTIEVSNRVNTRVFLSDEALYNLYRELRGRGIIFTDIRADNLGYLLSSNEFNWSKPLADINSARGLGDESIETLGKDNLVIIDTDYIYKEDTNDRINYLSCKKFEQRYIEELEKQNSNGNKEYEKLIDELDNNLEKEQGEFIGNQKTTKIL